MVVVAFSYACFGMAVSVARQMVFMGKPCPGCMATFLSCTASMRHIGVYPRRIFLLCVPSARERKVIVLDRR